MLADDKPRLVALHACKCKKLLVQGTQAGLRGEVPGGGEEEACGRLTRLTLLVVICSRMPLITIARSRRVSRSSPRGLL